MFRAALTYSFLAIYVLLGTLIFVPWTWLTRDIRAIYWVARQGVRSAFGLSGVKVDSKRLERAFAHRSAVFVCNHVSNLEPAALFMTLPRIVVILKKELGRIPLLGYVMGLGGFIYVDRRDRRSRSEALRRAVETLNNGISLLVFPEGTRSPDGALLPFRPGPFTLAIEAGAPIVPITVHGARELMPKGRLTIRPGRVKLAFHAPVETAGLTLDDRAQVMDEVRETMRRALDQGV